MSEFLFSAMGGLVVCLAFTMGFLLGQITNYPREPTPEKAKADEEKRRKYEEELKAFTDCMNYSVEAAYGGRRDE